MLLDIRSQSTIADYFVICSAENDRQLKAIIDHIDEQVTQLYSMNARLEGVADSGWVVLDYADIVIHVFGMNQRDYYRLEQLWSKTPPLVVVQ